MATIDTSGKRPWPDSATIDDIRPGVILTMHYPSGATDTYVVVSEPDLEQGNIWMVPLEQALRFTYTEIVKELKLDKIPAARSLYRFGIVPIGGVWYPNMYCTVEGVIPERRGTLYRPYQPVALPEVIDPAGLERLLIKLGGTKRAVVELIERHGAHDALKLTFEDLDDRRISMLIVHCGLNGNEPLTTEQMMPKFNVSRGVIQTNLASAIQSIQHVVHALPDNPK